MATTVAEICEMLERASFEEFEAIERSLAADTRKGVRKALAAKRKHIDVQNAERKRLESLAKFDRECLGNEVAGCVVGLDEVGRGAVAGPLAVGAVVLPDDCLIENLNDSKQLSPEQRETVALHIKETARAWAVAFVEPEDIDRNGMSESLRTAFGKALAMVEEKGERVAVVLVDGNPLGIDEREMNVVKGDSKSASIAAASVVAKVERDHLMCELSSTYPHYGFSSNKGYASEEHIQAIREFGLSPVHRRSFCKSFMQETLF